VIPTGVDLVPIGVSALLFPPKRDSKTLFIVLSFLSLKKIVSGYFPFGYLDIFATIIIPASFVKTNQVCP
jgi:hypothetical protein